MKIKIKAWIHAPNYLMFIGGVNKYVFSKEFEVKLTKAHLKTLLSEDRYIVIDGIRLRIQKMTKNLSSAEGYGHLEDVSVAHFQKLQKKGWVLNKASAEIYGFPNNEKNQKLQEHSKKQDAQSRAINKWALGVASGRIKLKIKLR